MKFKDIEKLVELIENSEIKTIEVKKFGSSVKISKNGQMQNFSTPNYENFSIAENTDKIEIEKEDKKDKEKKKAKNIKTVKSPIVGTFYRKPSPESSAFVEVGSQINVGDVVCIIEAMKIMNEIESEVTGKVTKILVEDGHMVEFGQDIFEVE